jgi:hypothetical protein
VTPAPLQIKFKLEKLLVGLVGAFGELLDTLLLGESLGCSAAVVLPNFTHTLPDHTYALLHSLVLLLQRLQTIFLLQRILRHLRFALATSLFIQFYRRLRVVMRPVGLRLRLP